MDSNKRHSQKIEPQIGGVKLVITTKEARKLLGKDFREMPDKAIEDIIIKLNLIAKGFIEQSVSI